MATFYADPTLGGSGNTYTDDNNPTTGMGNGGHRTRFIPALNDAVSIAQFVQDAATFINDNVVSVEPVFDTYAAANSAVGSLVNGQTIRIRADENASSPLTGKPTLRTVTGGVLGSPTDAFTAGGVQFASGASVQELKEVTVGNDLLNFPGARVYANARLTSDDSATDLSSAFASRSDNNVLRPIAWPYVDNGSGGTYSCMRIGSSVPVPADKHLQGYGNLTQFRPLAALGTNPMFLANVQADGVTPVVSTPLGFSSDISGLNVVNHDENGAAITNLGPIFKFAGQHQFSDIFTLLARGIIEQSTGSNSYSDLNRITRIRSQGQYDDGTYLINLATNGDGFVVEQVSNDGPEDPTGAGRKMLGHSLRAVAHSAGRFSELINGNVRLIGCNQVEVARLHNEWGFVESMHSNAVLENLIFYMRGDQTLGVDDPVVGVPLTISMTVGNYRVVHGNISAVRDVAFGYLAGWAYPWGYQNNFNIDYPQTVDFERIYRFYYHAAGTYTCVMGATQNRSADMIANNDNSHLDFNNYSHLASLKSRYTTGSAGGSNQVGRWLITAELGDNPATASFALSSGLFDSNSSNPNLQWNLAAGTYYYRAAFYQDKVRSIGVVGNTELALSPSGDNIPELRLSPLVHGSPMMVRIYRGTSANSYNAYVDIPLIAGGALFDNGLDCNGWQWIARTAGAADAVNTGMTRGYRLEPGNFDTNSDAYGHVTVYSDSGAVPTVGGWRQGDQVLLRSPFAQAGGVVYGYQRITDCLSTASVNVEYTDWLPIVFPNPIRRAATTDFQSAASLVNTKYKSGGTMLFNLTTNKPVWSVGSTPTSVWVDATGATVHTPV